MFGFNIGEWEWEEGQTWISIKYISFYILMVYLEETKLKYDKIHINPNVLVDFVVHKMYIWKLTLKSELNSLIKTDCNDIIDNFRMLTIHPWLGMTM